LISPARGLRWKAPKVLSNHVHDGTTGTAVSLSPEEVAMVERIERRRPALIAYDVCR
jgi:hypothetical protein